MTETGDKEEVNPKMAHRLSELERACTDTTVDSFLRRLAERLGLEQAGRHSIQGNLSTFWWVESRGEWVELNWLLTPPGAFFILKEMGKQPEEVRWKFGVALSHRDSPYQATESFVEQLIITLTPARIAQAAADALGVPK